MILELIVGIFILAFSVMDIQYGKIPSFITTAVILALLLLRPENLIYGLSGLAFGLVIYEMFDGAYIGGIADIKVMAIIGFLLTSIISFAIYMLVFSFVGFLYITVLDVWTKKKKHKWKDNEVPFVPALWIVYLLLLFAGVIG